MRETCRRPFTNLTEFRKAMVAVGLKNGVRLRVKTDRPGTIGFTLCPSHRRFADENVHVPDLPTDSQWRDITLYPEDFLVSQNARPVGAGYPVHTVNVWGFGTGTVYVDRIAVLEKQ